MRSYSRASSAATCPDRPSVSIVSISRPPGWSAAHSITRALGAVRFHSSPMRANVRVVARFRPCLFQRLAGLEAAAGQTPFAGEDTPVRGHSTQEVVALGVL